MATIRRVALFLSIAFSFGGFSFYAGIVVPIGSDVFDATSQGFVTQRATDILNLASGVSGLLLFWEAIAGWKHRTRRQNILYWSALSIYAIALIALIGLHPQMDQLLEPSHFLVKEPLRFYNLHRIYLWASTFQWLATIVLIVSICRTHSGAGSQS